MTDPATIPARLRWVRQEETRGCALACIAMVTGQTYAAVRAAWPSDCDFDGECGGIDHFDVMHYLGDRGIPYHMRYRFELGRNGVGRQVIRADWPQPFAPTHIIGINGGRHDVVLLADGTVLDPAQPEPRRLSDVGPVSFMVGVWPMMRLPLREAAADAIREPSLPEDCGLGVDMLDADRLRSWANLIDIHGGDITHWGQVGFVVSKLREIAGGIESVVRDVGKLRAAIRVPPAPPDGDQ